MQGMYNAKEREEFIQNIGWKDKRKEATRRTQT
jgi:hypothetical protein